MSDDVGAAVRKLNKPLSMCQAELTLKTQRLRQFEVYKDKESNVLRGVRLQSTGKIVTAGKHLGVVRQALHREAIKQLHGKPVQYANGTYTPEIACTKFKHTTLNPGEAGQPYGHLCHVWQAKYQGVVPRKPWEGRLSKAVPQCILVWALNNTTRSKIVKLKRREPKRMI